MADPEQGLSRGATTACAITCGAMVANLYYAQPLIGTIAPALGIGPSLAGMVVAITQLGYGLGLFLLVPLADRVENRRLITGALLATAVTLSAVALAPSRSLFLAAAIVLGFSTTGAQIVLPFVASLTPEERRGRVVGNVMGGLLAGIMLARPLASIVAGMAGWRAVFGLSALVTLGLAWWVRHALPERQPHARESYGAILRSTGRILVETPPLQRRAVYQGLAFAVFNIFWTAVPLELVRRFGLGSEGIALFALAGAGGALAAPVAGRLGDRGHVRLGTGIALATLTASIALAGWAAAAGALVLLAIVGVTLDAGTQVNQVLSQRVIYTLPGEHRGRLNAIYMTIVFLFGSAGSAVATVADHAGGWTGVATLGTAIGLVLLVIFATEFRLRSAARQPA